MVMFVLGLLHSRDDSFSHSGTGGKHASGQLLDQVGSVEGQGGQHMSSGLSMRVSNEVLQ